MSDSRLQEIVTNAVVGRAERRVSWGHTVPAEGVTAVLGVRVTNATVAVKDEDGRPMVDLLVDCDLWCGGEKKTKVLRCTCRNTDSVALKTTGQVLGDREMKVTMTGPARATGVDVRNEQVVLTLEADIAVEMSGRTRMWVRAYDLAGVQGEEVDGDEDLSNSSSYSGFGTASGSGSSSGTGR